MATPGSDKDVCPAWVGLPGMGTMQWRLDQVLEEALPAVPWKNHSLRIKKRYLSFLIAGIHHSLNKEDGLFGREAPMN